MFRSLLAVLLLWLAALAPAAAQPLRLATGNDYAPFADQHEPEGGALTALVRAAFAAIGRDTEVTHTSWNRALEETRQGRFDVTAPYVLGPERQAYFLNSSILLPVDSYILSAARREPKLPLSNATPPDGLGHRACVPLGWHPHAVLQPLLDNGSAIRIDPAYAASCLKMILADRADFFIVNKPVAWHLMRRETLTPQQFRFSEQPVGRTSLHLLISRAHPDALKLLADFERGLDNIRSDGSAEKLLRRLGVVE
ncbi:transporter substrate-binding domain-containing protein [Ferrovibrio sp.]|uniref:substrate-binding periplasmic protein n=1 Tax=Ferrovibrio sp. TaxID=1917215 RepID=UPI001B5DB669|nr:transporter substrate-binding domain-containing protein [Ferrovibrio sp.]MBP7065372.1 transporter substrate-binding domain-containing protein [Ferrovibrio sp.]